jgi:MFS family permease
MYPLEVQQVVNRTSHANRVAVTSISRVVWFLGVTSFFTDISSESVNSVMPVYLLLHLGFTPFQFGIIEGLYQGAAAVLRIWGGFAADRWSRPKGVAAAGYILSAVSRVGLLLVTALPGIAATILVDRVGKAVRTAPRDTLISLNSTPSAMATAFGVHRTLDAAGALIGPAIAFLVLGTFVEAYDTVFFISFCMAVVGVAVLLLFVDERPRQTGSVPSISWASVYGLVHHAALRRIAAVGALLGLATISDAFMYVVLQRKVGVTAGAFPLLYLGTALSYMLLAVPAGRLADRLGRNTIFIAGHAAVLLIYILLMSAPTGATTIVSCVLLLGAYYAATDGVLMALASSCSPRALRGSALAMVSTCTVGAKMVSAVLFGWLWTVVGTDGAIVCFGTALTAGTVFAAGLLRSSHTPTSDD